MYGPYLSFLLPLLGLLVKITIAQGQQDFCNRLYHSSLVVNDQLYVDGGELRERNGSDFVRVSLPNNVATADLSKPWGNGDDSIWRYISKTAKTPGSSPPTLNDGSIFSDNSSLYFFGGALSLAPGAPSTPPPNALWQFDIDKQEWKTAAPRGDAVERIHIGSNVQSTKPQGYYLGGAITPKSDAAFNAQKNAMPYMVGGLLVFNETSVEFNNVSSSGLDAEGTAAGGFLSLIESLGDEGVLVAFGGFSNVPGQPMSLTDRDLQNPLLHRLFGNVSIYDISNQKWYQQETTGNVPPWRYFGCSVVVSALDKSSHSIYVFGGWGGNSRNSDGNVYVLSIPSFRWIRVTNDNDQRQRHQCHLLGRHTMLVVGGIQPGDDNNQPGDVSGCDTSTKFAQGLGIFSLNDHSWKTNYDPTDGTAAYQVHPSISKVIGGDQNGAATLTTPDGGFSEQALGSLIGFSGRTNATSTPTPSNVPSASASGKPAAGKKLGGGAIAGIIIGAVVVIAVIIGALVFAMFQRRHQRQNPNVTSIPASTGKYVGELDDGSSKPSEKEHETKYESHELMAQNKPLPEAPGHDQRLEPQEMEAGGTVGWRRTSRALSPD